MAGLTEQAATTESWVLGPVVGGDGTGVAGVNERFRATEAGQLLLEIDQQRRKTTVEANHQQLLAGVGRFNGGELFCREAKWFLHEHVLAGGEGLLHEERMAVVAGGDHHGVAAGVS